MSRILPTATLAILASAFAFGASAHDHRDAPPPPPPRHGAASALHLENTWTGVNGATRNRNSSLRYAMDHLPPLPTHGVCHAGPPPEGGHHPHHGRHHGHGKRHGHGPRH